MILHVDAIQTALPGKVAHPGLARRIVMAAPLGPEVLQRRFQVVLYYGKAGDEEVESPLTVAAWIKESLSAVLSGHPILSGRLRNSGGSWEVKFNDSGVRLVQATAEMTMSEFLASEDRDGKEAQLAYWEDINEDDPNFSALFYIQVTQFQGDGYAIGISCSLLLADPLFLSRFLRSWSQTHMQLLAQGRLTKPPMFHLSYFRGPNRPRRVKSVPFTSSSATTTTTMLFKADPPPDAQSYSDLSAACLREATRRLGAEAVPEFSLMISDHTGDLKVGSHGATGLAYPKQVLEVVRWSQLGMEEVAFTPGNRPVHVSHQIVSCGHSRLVIAMMTSEAVGDPKLTISVTVPNN
ncbi:hypothetical protein OPV22_007195 [Ensete ventricosum]|uniref:START domain-containing protein n=1 Tax=Ensete ventricosum TaxID=4639 RepID=A0AAV8RRA0_ENSVE|nr:hypothetical protein OPV22_007195 [Ensete ventricosum]